PRDWSSDVCSSDLACVLTTVGNTVFVGAGTACAPGTSATSMSATGPTFTLPAPTLGFAVSKVVSLPGGPVAGQPVTYWIVVTNTGQATLTNMTLWDTVSPVIMSPVTTQPSGINAPVVTQAGTGTYFVWSSGPSFTLSTTGAVNTFTITVTGTIGQVCATTAVSE